jgi:tetratricopeptide (TPR) repeat protein
MGLALYMLGDYAQAVFYMEAAVSFLPADATVNEHLGDVYWRLGRKNEARFQWERTLAYTKEEAVLQGIRKKLKEGLPALSITKDTSKDSSKDNVKITPPPATPAFSG